MTIVNTSVLVCLKCKHENPLRTDYCMNCASRLGTQTVAPHTKELYLPNFPVLEPDAQRISMTFPVGNTVLFQLKEQSISVNLPLNRTILLGRSTCRDSTFSFDEMIALNIYGAVDAGVSRQHALLARMIDGLRIVDLDSRNGSYIQGQKLQPFHAYELAGNEVIQLGKLTFQLYREGQMAY